MRPMDDTTINLEETYLTIWKRMLGGILGWSEQKVTAWAAKYEPFLADPDDVIYDDVIYHEDPQYWAVSALVPTAINEKISPSLRSHLRKELLDLLGVQMYLVDYLGVDWKQYKSGINTIIEKYAT